METAVFATGCFWCTEAIFQSLKGVQLVMPGYTDGQTPNPTYEQVCTGNTGHAECAKITFNPAEISYEDLLKVFWYCHDPTSLNRQGNDVGTQYRSAIFATTPRQLELAEASKQQANQDDFNNKIVTEIKMLGEFYEAEDYHRDYFKLHSNQPYCTFVIRPKLTAVLKKFKDLTKSA